MQTLKVKNGIFFLVFFVFTVLHLSLICTARMIPFVDLPNHLALATIVKFYGELSNQFARYYAVDMFFRPNVFHLVFCASDIFPSVEFANKVFYCVYVVLFPMSIFLVIKKLRGNPWFAILSFLFIYNYSVCYGFVGYTIAIPFVLLSFYFALDYSEENSSWTKFVLMALFILLFFMHALAAIFSLLIFSFCCICQKKHSIKKILKKSVITVPSIIIIIIWWAGDKSEYGGPGLLSFLFDYYKNEYIQTLNLRAGLFVFDNYTLFDGVSGYATALFFSLFTFTTVFRSLLFNKKTIIHSLNDNKYRQVIVLVLLSLICFLLIPLRLPGYSFLLQRFSVFFFIAIIILGSLISSKKPRPFTICIICAVVFTHFYLWNDYFDDFKKENKLFSKNLFTVNSKNTKMAGMIYDYKFRGRPVYEQFLDYYIVWKQGVATTRFIDERSFPVTRKVDTDVLPAYLHNVGKFDNYDGRYTDMDYILLRGELSDTAKKYLINTPVINSAGKWAILKIK